MSNRLPPLSPTAAAGSLHFAGAIYGSLLVAATVLGAAAYRDDARDGLKLLVAIVGTSTVFWAMHTYVQMVGRHWVETGSWRAGLARSAYEESPILVAAVPPCAYIVVAELLDEPFDRLGWGTFLVAIVGQVGWTWFAVRRVHERRTVAALSVAVSVLLGLVLVLVKYAVTH